ncbi:non-hydrolyzing UDP-N-acetylglucosamine 2-epimerase (plasmid) [Enterococcus faecium]|uniref:non-hydrolyzing UDP-N-acetylglucosamine 2-epimerase n=1 Tax=Enterococcus faecium TaxID=1352 RepID=UPI0038D3CFD9
MKPVKLFIVFGTRPEAIKMAPLVIEAQQDPRFEVKTIVTGQHREMLDSILASFHLVPDYDLNIMSVNQNLTTITNKILSQLHVIFSQDKPDILLVHGDTSTTFAASLAAFYHQIKIGHVEAGLRTWDKYSPFPEEMNRQLTDVLADMYFAPTQKNKENLLRENHPNKRIYVTGNTAIDALKYTICSNYEHPVLTNYYGKKIILLTVHRRENLGEPMINIFKAINQLVEKNEDIVVVFPIHKNPKVRNLATKHLCRSDRLKIIEPLDVVDFHNIASRSFLILSDSGGIQEEAPYMKKPVFVLRTETERPEGVEAGTLQLVGTDTKKIVDTVTRFLTDDNLYSEAANSLNPYGDGNASKRILEAILNDR